MSKNSISGQGSGGYNPGTTTTTTRRPPTTTPWGYNPGGRPPTDRPGGGWSYTSTGRPAFTTTTTTTRYCRKDYCIIFLVTELAKPTLIIKI